MRLSPSRTHTSVDDDQRGEKERKGMVRWNLVFGGASGRGPLLLTGSAQSWPTSAIRLGRLGVCCVVGAAALVFHPVTAAAASNTVPVPAIAPSVAVGPAMGVTFFQVDYNWDTSPDIDSGTGELDVDIATLTSATGIPSGFLNVGNSNGWVVQNLPVDATDDPYASI